jgi:hypothetical protein
MTYKKQPKLLHTMLSAPRRVRRWGYPVIPAEDGGVSRTTKNQPETYRADFFDQNRFYGRLRPAPGLGRSPSERSKVSRLPRACGI